ncbi:SBBP repeat-containing protein [Nitrospirota bacterium]
MPHLWGGIFNSPQSVTISCDDGAGSGCANIYYTLDGSTPNTASDLYSDAIDIVNSTVLSFFANDVDGNSETINTQSYLIDVPASNGWIIQHGTGFDDFAYAVATDGSENVYVTGITDGGLDGNTNAGNWDLFLVKYDSAGEKQWTRQMGSSGTEWGYGVATDSSGSVYVTGTTDGELDGNTSAGARDLYLVKYDSAGVKQWTIQNGTSATDEAYAVATDSSGNVYVAGRTDGDLDGNTNAGLVDIFVIKYNSSGAKQWTRQMGWSGNEQARGVATDSSGNVYITGASSGGLDGYTNIGDWDIFVVKYDTSGVKQWTRLIGTVNWDEAYGIATDGYGNVYVAGRTDGDLDGNTNTGGEDIFVIKYDSDGGKQWTRQMGTIGNDQAKGVSTDSSGNVYVAGYTYGDLDGNTNTGGADMLIVKYDSAGGKKWTWQMGSSGLDFTYGTASDSSGSIIVAGQIYGSLDGNESAGMADMFVVKISPTGGVPTGAILINSGEAFVNTTDVTLALTCSDDVWGSGCTEARVSNDEVAWSNFTIANTLNVPSWNLGENEGLNTVYVQFKDAAGNWSGSFSDTITIAPYSITGRVYDSNNNPVDNAKVLIKLNGASTAMVATDALGDYLYEHISSGDYKLGVRKSGCYMMIKYFTVSGSNTTLNLKLRCRVDN